MYFDAELYFDNFLLLCRCGNNNVCTPLFCESRGKICFPSTLSGSTARCVECVQDSDCSGAGVCTAFNTCESKNCQFDNDCRTDPLCNAECHLDGFSFTKWWRFLEISLTLFDCRTCIVPFGEGNLNCTAAGTVCQKDFGTCSNVCDGKRENNLFYSLFRIVNEMVVRLASLVNEKNTCRQHVSHWQHPNQPLVRPTTIVRRLPQHLFVIQNGVFVWNVKKKKTVLEKKNLLGKEKIVAIEKL